MERSEVFDRLVKELDPIERKELLDKLTPDKIIEAEPMIRKEKDQDVDLEKEYYSLGFISRIIIFFKVVFRGEDKFQLTEELILKNIDRDLRKSSGPLISYEKGKILSPFLDEIEKLAEAASFFEPCIATACGPGRDEFLNFLGSMQIPVIHHQLILDTDYERVEKNTGFSNPNDVRKDVMMSIESNLAKITGDLRNSMYVHSKTIFIIGELVKFDFSGFMELFSGTAENEAKSCYFGDARNRLEHLTEILSAFRVSPDKQLLEAIYLFHNNSLKVNDEQAISEELKAFLEASSGNLKVIRKFNLKTRLPRMMKLVTGNIDYKPKPISGGEDWFNLYSRYWTNLAEMKFKNYSAMKRKQKLYQDMQMYFKKDSMPVLEYYRYKYRYSCGFLNLFLREQFTAGMNEVLKKILVDGRFYKKQNKEEFTDAYSALLGLYEKIRTFDEKNSAKGEYGMKIDAIKAEAMGESVREKRIAAVVEGADFEAFEIIKIGTDGLELMKNILYGILHGKAGGQYDSLSNLNKLITIESRDFIIDLNDVYTRVIDAGRILSDIVALEDAE